MPLEKLTYQFIEYIWIKNLTELKTFQQYFISFYLKRDRVTKERPALTDKSVKMATVVSKPRRMFEAAIFESPNQMKIFCIK